MLRLRFAAVGERFLEKLSSRDQNAALEFLRDAYVARDFDRFIAFLLEELPKLVRSEVTSYNEMRPRERYSKNWVKPESLMVPKRDEAWANVMHEHPVVVALPLSVSHS
jgi:hypothetical protein